MQLVDELRRRFDGSPATIANQSLPPEQPDPQAPAQSAAATQTGADRNIAAKDHYEDSIVLVKTPEDTRVPGAFAPSRSAMTSAQSQHVPVHRLHLRQAAQDNLMHLVSNTSTAVVNRRIRQCFFRWLNNFRADGPIPVTSTFDHGFENRITFRLRRMMPGSSIAPRGHLLSTLVARTLVLCFKAIAT